MVKQQVILLDVDDVTLDLISWWLTRYNSDWDDNLSESDIKSWAIAEYTKCGDRIYDYLKESSLYDCVLPIVGATWGIRRLNGMGFRLVFVTASTPEQSGVKYYKLKDYDLLERREDYIEALDKSLILGDYLVDDNPKNVINFKGCGIVFTKEWNKSLEGYDRVNDWSDIVSYFSKIAQQREIIGV